MTYTIYTAISEPDEDGDRVERMALHPVLDSEPMGKGPPFPCRVVWRFIENETWTASCRGLDGASQLPTGPDRCAIRWLLEGEG